MSIQPPPPFLESVDLLLNVNPFIVYEKDGKESGYDTGETMTFILILRTNNSFFSNAQLNLILQ